MGCTSGRYFEAAKAREGGVSRGLPLTKIQFFVLPWLFLLPWKLHCFAVAFSFAVEIMLFYREFLFGFRQAGLFGLNLFSLSCFLVCLAASLLFCRDTCGPP